MAGFASELDGGHGQLPDTRVMGQQWPRLPVILVVWSFWRALGL